MRKFLLLILCVVTSACSSETAPSNPGSLGSSLNISGNWTGVMSSSNNPAETITMELTQASGSVSGPWRGTVIAWSGQVSGTLSSGSFSGQMTFTGLAVDGSTCTGTANVTGSASSSTLSWTSGQGVVGASCGAPMPAGVTVEMSR